MYIKEAVVLFLESLQSWTKYLQTFSPLYLDYYNQKVNVRVVKRVKTYDLRAFRNLNKIPEMLGIDIEYPAGHPKGKF